jgi:hypothetical protein
LTTGTKKIQMYKCVPQYAWKTKRNW